MIKKATYFIVDNYKTFSLVIKTSVIVSVYFIISGLKVDNSLKIWFSKNDKAYQNFLDFQDKYGNDDIITLLVSYPFKVFELRAVSDLLALEKNLGELDYVDKIYSYGSSNHLNASGSEFYIEKIVTGIPNNSIEKERIIDRVNKLSLIKNTFISNDEKSQLILIKLAPFEQIEVLNSSFMNSDFCYSDLKSWKLEENQNRLVNETDNHFYIESIFRNLFLNQRLLMKINKETYFIEEVLFFNKGCDHPVRKMIAHKINEEAGIYFSTHFKMIRYFECSRKVRSSSEIIFTNWDIKSEINEAVFTASYIINMEF